MPVKITCPDPECGATFRVGDKMAGAKVKCPRCGKDIVVEAPVPQLALKEQPAPTPAPPAGQPGTGNGQAYVHHPARQVCPRCKAVLGVRVAICPQCGADIRTGAIADDGGQRSGPTLTPLILGGGLVVALGGLVGLVVLVVGLLSGKAEPPAQHPGPPAMQGRAPRPAPPAQQPAAQRPQPARPQPAQPQPARPAPAQSQPSGQRGQLRVPPEAVARLDEAEADARSVARKYMDRLAEVLGYMRTAPPEAMAARWAGLYEFCMVEGLEAEAEQCWYRAVALRPADPEVNRRLGRTETCAGQPVTPEEAAFLAGLAPLMRIVNADPDLDNHVLRLQDGAPVPFPPGQPLEFRPAPGTVRVVIYENGSPDRPEVLLELDAVAGVVQDVEVRSPFSAPTLPFGLMENLSTAVIEGRSGRGVTVQTDPGGVVMARTGVLSLVRMGQEPARMWLPRRQDQVGLVGRLGVGSPYHPHGQHVICGTGDSAATLALNATAKSIALRSGAYCVVRSELSGSLWGILTMMRGQLGDEWERTQLVRRLREVDAEDAELEARGELAGPWEAVQRLNGKLSEFRQQQFRDRALRDAASRLAVHTDRVRALGLEDRATYLYMNWPRFRVALAAALGGSWRDIRARLDMIGVAPDSPQWPGELVIARPDELDASTYMPAPVAADRAQDTMTNLRLLALLPDAAITSQVAGLWGKAGPQERAAALDALGLTASEDAVAFAGKLTTEAEDVGLRQQAYVVLGVIGTPRALLYCDVPALTAETRTASRAARAVAGDPAVLEGLLGFLAESDSSEGLRFVDLVSRYDTPGALLALSRVMDSELTGQRGAAIATALARIGGQTAVYELSRLVAKTEAISPEAIRLLRPEECEALVRPLGRALERGQQTRAVADLLARIPSDAATACLESAAADLGLEDAVLALGKRATTQSLGAAARGASALTDKGLGELCQAWFVSGQGGAIGWAPGVDGYAVRIFLDRVFQQHPDPKLRLSAAVLLRQVGMPLSPDALAALARTGETAGRGGKPVPPAGFEQPDGVPLEPVLGALSAPPALYALWLLEQDGSPQALGQLRRLAAGYRSGALRGAARVALARAGGEAELQGLREIATGRVTQFADLREFVTDLEDRLSALWALGAVADAGILPGLLDVLYERQLPTGTIQTPVSDYEILSAWRQMTLHSAACECLASACRKATPAELAGDPDLARALQARVTELIEQPGASDPALTVDRASLRASAVRAFGRLASPQDYASQLLISRLLMGVQQAGDQSQLEPRLLRAALLDAVVYMTVRGGRDTALKDTFDKLLAVPGAKQEWRGLIRGMAAYPAAGFFALVLSRQDALTKDDLQAVATTAYRAGASGPEYARVVTTALRGAEIKAVPKGGPPAPQAPARPSVSEDESLPRWLREQLAASRAADAAAPQAQPSAAAQSQQPTTEASQQWADSLDVLAGDAGKYASVLRLVEYLFSNNDEALTAALENPGALGDSPVAPMVAYRYVQRVPFRQTEFVGELAKILLAGARRSGTVSLDAQRAAVIALRRIGGQAGAQALLLGLIGPELDQAGMRRVASGGVGPSPVGTDIARALGSMGETALLNKALSASTSEVFAANPVAAQAAALWGIAYLPASANPLGILGSLLPKAGADVLRQVAGDAISVAARRLAPGGAGSSP